MRKGEKGRYRERETEKERESHFVDGVGWEREREG